MPDVKPAGTDYEPALNARKGLPPVRQPAEISDSNTLIREISAAIEEQLEKTRSSNEDEKQEKSGDTAHISEVRRWFHTDGTIPADGTFLWVLDMEEDWQSLLEWQPDPDADLPKQLQQLSKLYLALLESALKYAEGANLAEQLERLDSLLAQKLDLVMKQDLEHLTSLLKETGQTTELDSIRSSLYRQTAGRTISYQDARTLFTYGGAVNGKISKEGMIYHSSGKQNIRFQQTCDTQQNSWKEQLRQRNQTITNARKGIAENTFKQGSSIFCSGKELVRANGFAAHISGSGNLFKNPDISARNEEVTGLLAAIMTIKGQMYTKESLRTSSIIFSLQNAIEKIICQYLGQKGASNVYYYTLAAYKQMKNPKAAIENGQEYAYQQFHKKQKEPAYQNSPHYSEDSGFFRSLLKGLSPEKEFSMGLAILQKDWQNFLYAIGNQRHSPGLSQTEIYSPWGVLTAAGALTTSIGGNIKKILPGAVTVIIIGALAAVCFRL